MDKKVSFNKDTNFGHRLNVKYRIYTWKERKSCATIKYYMRIHIIDFKEKGIRRYVKSFWKFESLFKYRSNIICQIEGINADLKLFP